MSDSQTLVVKLGTSVLTGGSRRLNRAHIVELVRHAHSCTPWATVLSL
jgi:glutamate 5-kinase